ncbi:unnamed protein product [Mesocestoides corti]|uniref:Uncharacterized protein n=2 Tax=Mesocestoides corti TaxID=53468 RepID=A0A0R3U3L2_MESCO|nr:unnamed protein product [Mesocestoides corti]
MPEMRLFTGLCLLVLLLLTHEVVGAGEDKAKELESKVLEVLEGDADDTVEEIEKYGDVETQDVLAPSGWRRLRRRISGGLRRIFRKPRRICFPYCPTGPRYPGPRPY